MDHGSEKDCSQQPSLGEENVSEEISNKIKLEEFS
jgi:hypothetical protein